MSALVVVESCWGNTYRVAEAIRDGLASSGREVALVSAAEAPEVVGPEVALLLIGAPTHNMGLPTSASRRQALERGGTAPSSGVREWLERVRIDGAPATFAFDTHVAKFSGSAARKIVSALRKRRVQAEVGERFVVAGATPELEEGALERARDWGVALSR